ncbi:MAG: hypothetical protein DWC07_04035 [Candidatus Poseidoniales archaeon]|nr:MAG: hypothetical protein DWC07_04035 [Candidatus Poseidoniales archaeon]
MSGTFSSLGASFFSTVILAFFFDFVGIGHSFLDVLVGLEYMKNRTTVEAMVGCFGWSINR